MVKYPDDWYCHLKEGDVVKCVSCTYTSNKATRKVGKEYNIVEDSKGEKVIHHGPGVRALGCLEDFIPVYMAAFPDEHKRQIIKYSIF